MVMQNRLLSLRQYHQNLERTIDEERKRAYPDTDHIRELKTRKLAVKDEISRLTEDLGEARSVRRQVAA